MASRTCDRHNGNIILRFRLGNVVLSDGSASSLNSCYAPLVSLATLAGITIRLAHLSAIATSFHKA